MKRPQVAVLGAGIAGLSVAHRVRELLPSAEITLIEARDRLGGIIATVKRDGFVIEEGPDSFLATKPAGLKLCRELGLDRYLQQTIPGRRASVWWDDRLLPLPEGLSGLVPARPEALAASELLSPAGKERVAAEVDIPALPPGGDETLGAFMTRRFGQEAYQRLIEPLMAGIYAGDGNQLSTAATFPRLRDLELTYGSVVRGMKAQADAAPAGAASTPSPFRTPRQGMQEMVDALVGRLAGVTIRRNTRAIGLERTVTGYLVAFDQGPPLAADEVVLALPAHQSAELTSSLHADLAATLRSIPYASTATISLAFPASAVPHPLDGTGYVVPRLANRPVLACTWTSSKFRHRAPPGSVLLRAFIGRYGHEEALSASPQELLHLARAEFKEVLGIVSPPTTWLLSHWRRAMPQYTLGHLDRLASIQRFLQELPGLSLAGSAYRGVGIPDCIAGGDEVARQIAGRWPTDDRQ